MAVHGKIERGVAFSHDAAVQENEDEIRMGLERVSGQQNASAPQGAASQGALGPPAQAGDDSPTAFGPQPEAVPLTDEVAGAPKLRESRLR